SRINKKPRARPGVFNYLAVPAWRPAFAALRRASEQARQSFSGGGRSEAIIHARAHEMGVEVDAVADRAAGNAAVERAEVDVEIFALDRQIAPDRVFEASAGGPTNSGLGGRAEHRFGGLDVARGAAGGDIGHQAAPAGIADPAAHRGEPIIFGLAAVDAASGVALDVRPIDVAFDAPDPHAGLEIVAKRAADDRTLRAG